MKRDTTFSIEAKINPDTKQPFGTTYAGTFSVRRPTLQDKTNIALRCAANLSMAGGFGINMITDELIDANYIFAQMSVISTTELPAWFDKDKIYEEDEPAVQAVAQEVRSFIDSFRSKKDSGDGK